jgi:hypothetical protein
MLPGCERLQASQAQFSKLHVSPSLCVYNGPVTVLGVSLPNAGHRRLGRVLSTEVDQVEVQLPSSRRSVLCELLSYTNTSQQKLW